MRTLVSFGGLSAVGTSEASPRALLLLLLLLLLLPSLLPKLLLVDIVRVSCVWCVCFFLLSPRVDVPSGYC